MKRPSLLLMILTILAIGLLSAVSPIYAAVPYATPGATYTQNFNWTTNGTSTSQTVAWTSDAASQPVTTVTWLPDASSLGWYAGSHLQDSTSFRVGNGSDTDNASLKINNYYWASGDTDRSFGGRPTSTVPMVLALALMNTTGMTLTEFTLGYRLEVTQWRANGNQATAQVSYFVGNPSNWRTDSFTAAAELNLSTVYGGNPAVSVSNVNGNDAGNYNTLAPTTVTGINWTPDSVLWIRWTFPTGVNLPNVGMDDVTFSAIPEPSTGLLLMAGCGLVLALRRSRRSGARPVGLRA